MPLSGKAHYFDKKMFFHWMLRLQHRVYPVEHPRMIVTLAALSTDFSLDVLDQIKFAPEPMLLPYFSRHGLAATKFAIHKSSVDSSESLPFRNYRAATLTSSFEKTRSIIGSKYSSGSVS